MTDCVSCGQPIPDNSPLSVAEVKLAVGGDDYWYQNIGSKSNSALTVRNESWAVALIENIDRGYDNEGPLKTIFQVDGPAGKQFFQITGHYSSYDGFDWDGPLLEVFAKKKTVYVYE